MGELPEEALAKLYVDGDAATKAAEGAGGALGRREPAEGVRRRARRRVERYPLRGRADERSSRTASRASSRTSRSCSRPRPRTRSPSSPATASARSTRSLRQTPGAFDQLQELLGIDLEGPLGLFDGEFAFWVGQGAPIPELTFLAEVEDEAAALAALDRLAGLIPPEAGARSARPRSTVSRRSRSCSTGSRSPTRRSTASVIVTSRPGAIADVRAGGDSLADDPDFKQAAEDAGMGDETFGFLYLDLEQLGGLLEGFAGLAGENVPPELSRNLEPLGAFMFHSSGKPEDLKLSAFLAIE